MSESAWPIRIVPSGGMRIMLTANPESVHVCIVSSSPSTLSTIVESGGMRVYVVNPEALPYEYREQSVPRQGTTPSGRVGVQNPEVCPHCGKSGPDWVESKLALVYRQTGRSQPLIGTIGAGVVCLLLGLVALPPSFGVPIPIPILCFLLGIFLLVIVVRTPKGMSYYCKNCREKWAVPFKVKSVSLSSTSSLPTPMSHPPNVVPRHPGEAPFEGPGTMDDLIDEIIRHKKSQSEGPPPDVFPRHPGEAPLEVIGMMVDLAVEVIRHKKSRSTAAEELKEKLEPTYSATFIQGAHIAFLDLLGKKKLWPPGTAEDLEGAVQDADEREAIDKKFREE